MEVVKDWRYNDDVMLREELSTNIVIVTSFGIMFRHVFALLREQYKASSLLEMLLIPSHDRISELPHRYELLNDIVEVSLISLVVSLL